MSWLLLEIRKEKYEKKVALQLALAAERKADGGETAKKKKTLIRSRLHKQQIADLWLATMAIMIITICASNQWIEATTTQQSGVVNTQYFHQYKQNSIGYGNGW